MVGCAIKTSSSQPISVQTWLTNPNPETVLFWPPPLNSEILMGPKLISGKTDHIFLFYGDRKTIAPESFTIYISEGSDFPVDFGRDKADTITRFEHINIAEDPHKVEILTRTKSPDQGIVLFQINNSNVVIQWNGVNDQTILDLLENNIVHLSPDDVTLIADIENHIATLNK